MGVFYDSIPPRILEWIQKQHIFFVASAPLKSDGHVNLSPKGYEDTFHIVNERRVWYEDLTGSGSETMAHLRENGRITIMFIAFNGPPNIVRFFGTGTVHEFGTPEYDLYITPEARKPGSRAVIVIDIYKVATSCGYGVPIYTFDHDRATMLEWCVNRERKEGEKGMKHWWQEQNTTSLDGMPALNVAAYTERGFHVDEAKVVEFKERNKPNQKRLEGFNTRDVILSFMAGAVLAVACMKAASMR